MNERELRALIAKYFPADQRENAYRVAMAESSDGDPGAHNTKGEDSRGLFQINVAPDANPDLARYNLFDPETNVRVAAAMWRERGWGPWTTARQMGLVSGGRGPGLSKLPASPGERGQMAGTLPKTLSAKGLNDLAAEHGGHKTQVVHPQSVKDIAAGGAIRTTFEFGDGTSIDATWSQDNTAWVVNDWGTVGKAASKDNRYVNSDVGDRWILRETPDGTLEQVPNPNYNPSTQQPKFQLVSDPEDGSVWTWDPVTGTTGKQIFGPKKDPPVFKEYGNKVYRVDTSGQLTEVMTISSDRNPLDDAYKRAQIAKMEQESTPPVTLLLQQRDQVAQQLADDIRKGRRTTEDAGRIMAGVDAQLDAALQGATPHQLDESKRRAATERRALGNSILNQRLDSATSMGQSLISSATSLAGRAMSGAGGVERINFDPLAMARQFSVDTGGGQEIYDMGKALLGGAPGAPPMGGGAPGGLPIGGGTPAPPVPPGGGGGITPEEQQRRIREIQARSAGQQGPAVGPSVPNLPLQPRGGGGMRIM